MEISYDACRLQCDSALLFSSRIQYLPTFTENSKAQVWAKREDESGFGISGCKKRKYSSLLPFIQKGGYEKTILVGGAHSNHLPAFVQLAREHQLNIGLYVKESSSEGKKGNAFLFDLLANPDEIRWVAKEDWGNVYRLAAEENIGNKVLVMEEGGSHPAAIPGLFLLAEDIEKNEESSDLLFDHIFIDAGTALTAAVLGYALAYFDKKTTLHVIHIAGGEQNFSTQWEAINQYFDTTIQPMNIEHLYPATAKSFGSVNARIWEEVGHLARTYGILADPIYTAKLFFTAKHTIQKAGLEGNILIIHAGGGTGLMGFGS